MSVAFGRYLYKIGVMPFYPVVKSVAIYLSHKFFGKSLHWLHQETFHAFFKDFPKALLIQYVEKFIETHLEELFYLPSKEALLKAQKEGQLIALLSSSPDFIVQPLAKHLNIPYWIGTCYAVDEENRLSEVSQIVDGEYKAEYLRKLMTRFQLKRENVTVYTDSILDLPLLMEAGVKIAVQPDNKLRAICKQNNWIVI